MNKGDVIHKVREHMRIAKSTALMMANAQSAADRLEYLKRLSGELRKAYVLLDNLEKD